jgi:hypothetical protein
VFQLHDNRTGEPREVQPSRRGQLWLYLAGGATGGALAGGTTGGAGVGSAAGADELRACLIADLVRRVAEQHHLRVSAWAAAAKAKAWDAMNIYPLEPSADVPQPLDVGIVPATAKPPGTSPASQPRPAAQPGPTTHPGPRGGAGEAQWLQPGTVTASADLGPDGLRAAGLDPLALRLAFLDRHYRQPLELSQAGLVAGDAELRAWREQVAGWAKSPSQPMCAQYLEDCLTAFDRDLDTASALTTLRALTADSAIPAGSKFETFAYLDRLAGLDLTREVGRP